MLDIQLIIILFFQVVFGEDLVKVKVEQSQLQGEKQLSSLGYKYLSFKWVPYAQSPLGVLKFQCAYCNRENGDDHPKVKVEQGILQGEKLRPSTKRGYYYSFKGIPYAKPPLGQLRFRAPEPPLKWNGVRKAFDHGPVCIQHQTFTSSLLVGNEDCLYLNVYTPNLDPSKALAVMFFIHPGLFTIGSGDDYFFAPDFLVGFNIVLVTMNYRLDALGFLSVDTKDVPGNAGLKDQVMALRWVKQNIAKFGGDPNKVTIFGQAAGAACVTYHMMSPASKGLFKRAIAMSGVLFNDFAISFGHYERAFNLGRKLGCVTNDTTELIDFLRSVPAERLIKVRPNILLSDKVSHSLMTTTYFAPIVEKKVGGFQFITEKPRTLVKNRSFNDVDLFIGHTLFEGIYAMLEYQDIILKYYKKFKQLYVPIKISNIRSIDQVLEIGDRVEKYYFGNKSVSLVDIDKFIEYYSFSHYIYDIAYFIDQFLPIKTSANRYVYVFSIKSSRNVYSAPAIQRYGINEATHRDDLPYLFDGKGYDLELDTESEAYDYIRLECRIFTNFAKYGTPTPNKSLGVKWPKYDESNRYVDISDKLRIRTIRYEGSLKFWDDVYKDAGVQPYVG